MLFGLLGCMSTPPIHPRALENAEMCSQYVASGDLARAEVHCDLGLQFSPHYADLWVNKGLIALRREQIPQAKEHFIKALRHNQEQAQAYNNLGFIYLKEGSLGRAHDNFQRALKVNPDYLEARWNLGLCFARMGQAQKARKQFNTIIAIAPNLADPHRELCVLAAQEEAYQAAVEHCLAALQRDPHFENAWLDLGAAYSELGRFAEAKECFQECLQVNENNAQCRHNLAIVARKGALFDEGLRQTQDTLTAENTPAAQFELAQVLRGRGLRKEELGAYQACLKLDPKFAACHYGRFSIAHEEGNVREATIACKNFLKFAHADEFPEQFARCERFVHSTDTF
jgi:tetratricopeptide (TPR) repeat protein